MSTEIKTFIFDCFGVICDPVINGWYKENRLKHNLIDNNIQNFLKGFDLGEVSEEGVVDYFLQYDGVNLTKEDLRKEIDSYLNLDFKLADTILKLKKKGFKTMLLSNANASFFERKIYPTYPKFKDLFDKIIISSEIRMVKPNPDIYMYALKEADSKPEELLFIDDSKINIDGALKVGMQGFLYTDNDSFEKYLKSIDVNLNN